MLTRYTQKNLTWIDLMAPAPEEVRALMHEFGFNPLVGQELLSVSAKSKVERYDGSIYAVFHFPVLHGAHLKRATQEVDIIIGREFLITTRYENITPLSNFAKAFEADSLIGQVQAHLHGGHLFAAIMKNMYRALESECDRIKTRLLEIEEHLFDGNEKDLVIEISQIGRVIYDFRQALAPHEEMLKSLEAPLSRMFGHEYSYYLRGIAAEYERLRAETEGMRDAMQELRETNNSMLNAKQNEVMKVFSVWAFVFVPASLMMTLFQLGLPDTPFGGKIDFWAVLGGIAVFSLIFFILFRRKGWL